MASKIELLQEGMRRGILSTDNKALYDEAVKRGMIEPVQPAAPTFTPSARQAQETSMQEYEANPPDYHRPSQLSRATHGLVNRTAALAAGGTAGTALGMPVGPPGMLAGGIGGVGAAGQAYDFAENVYRRAKGFQPTGKTVLDAFKTAGKDMIEEAAWNAGTQAAGPLLRKVGKPLLGKALGVLNEKSRLATDLAHTQGIKVGAAHVSPRKFVRGAIRVLGVFPFVGSHPRTGQARVVGQLDARAADILNTLAPTHTTALDLGENLAKRAAKRYGKADKIASTLYKRFYQLADDLPEHVRDIVPSSPLKTEYADLMGKQARGEITLTTGKKFQKMGVDTIGDWLKQFDDMPDFLTVEQARDLERTFNQAARQAAKDGFDVSRLSGMKRAMEKAKNSIDVSRLPPDVGEEVMASWNKANEFFHRSRKWFETSTANKFGRVDKNIFNKGVFKPGSINRDEVFDVVFKAKSPDAMTDLRNLVGDKEFKKASRQYLENAYSASKIPAKEGAITGEMFSAVNFEKRLGLTNPEGWESLKEMLRGSSVTVKDWKNFLNTAKTATDITIRDPSTYLTRRLTIGGSLAGGVFLMGGKVTIPATALIGYVARKGGKFLMDPDQLRMMTRVMKDSTTDHMRRTLLTRLFRLNKEPTTLGPYKGEYRPPLLEQSSAPEG